MDYNVGGCSSCPLCIPPSTTYMSLFCRTKNSNQGKAGFLFILDTSPDSNRYSFYGKLSKVLNSPGSKRPRKLFLGSISIREGGFSASRAPVSVVHSPPDHDRALLKI